MNTTTRTSVIIVALVIIVGAVFFAYKQAHAPSPASTTDTGSMASSSQLAFDNSISDGTVTVHYASSEFGLATNKTQILVHSFIPPCDNTFNYCLYYSGKTYEGTNFESAGIRIQKRTDLSTERLCLETSPIEFDSSTKPSSTKSNDAYSSSIFPNIGQGATGHTAEGSVYRLYVRDSGTCYEFQTRIGYSRFENYPAGQIKEFTVGDQTAIQNELERMMQNITLKQGAGDMFPVPAAGGTVQ